jgi:hypothetical protein
VQGRDKGKDRYGGKQRDRHQKQNAQMQRTAVHLPGPASMKARSVLAGQWDRHLPNSIAPSQVPFVLQMSHCASTKKRAKLTTQ